MPRKISLFLAALAATVSLIDGFKFMSNWQPPKILTDSQKVEIAKTEERFGNKSESLESSVMDDGLGCLCSLLHFQSNILDSCHSHHMPFLKTLSHRTCCHYWLFFWSRT